MNHEKEIIVTFADKTKPPFSVKGYGIGYKVEHGVLKVWKGSETDIWPLTIICHIHTSL